MRHSSRNHKLGCSLENTMKTGGRNNLVKGHYARYVDKDSSEEYTQRVCWCKKNGSEGGKGEDADTVAPTTVAPTTVAPTTAAPNVTTITTDPSVLDDSGGNQCPYNDDNTMTCRNNETCKSGEGCNIFSFCKTRGGRLRCPKSFPYMCTTNGITCSGSNCCERNASDCGKAGVLQEKNCPQPL
jgi:hypothetical protein